LTVHALDVCELMGLFLQPRDQINDLRARDPRVRIAFEASDPTAFCRRLNQAR